MTLEDIIHDKTLFPDFNYGPLTTYRQHSTIDYRKLRLAIKGEEVLRVQVIKSLKHPEERKYLSNH